MAEVRLTRAEAEHPGTLPCVCMQCGKPATAVVPTKYQNDAGWLLPLPEGGLILSLIGFFLAIFSLVLLITARRITVQVPLCERHARGWFSWLSLSGGHIDGEGVTMTGVSDEFVRALRAQRLHRQAVGERGAAA